MSKLSWLGIVCGACFLIFIAFLLRQNISGRLQGHFDRAKTSAAIGRSIEAIKSELGEVGAEEEPEPARFCPSEAAISFAKSSQLVWFSPILSGGAHTWVFNGAEVIKALTAYCGDKRLDNELLLQVRTLLDPNKGPTATGGYQDQKQLGAALMFFLVRRTPRIWNALSEAEQSLIDLTMEAFMYSSVFTTKDDVASSLGMNGDTNLNRDWNPNYQNGMVGMVIISALYWGFSDFESKLATFTDSEFKDRLRAQRMTNLLTTYDSPDRPDSSKIQFGLRKWVSGAVYRFHGITERNVLELFNYIARRTFSATISCGLNNGAGLNGFARIVKQCNSLPDVGYPGMILEFDGWDAEGKRSSASYSWDAWYPLNYVRVALQIQGWLNPSVIKKSATLNGTMMQYWRGTRDLWFKILPDMGGGYRDYEHGVGGPTVILDRDFERDRGARANLDLFNILQRTLDLPVVND
jgi:hypothetical protein